MPLATTARVTARASTAASATPRANSDRDRRNRNGTSADGGTATLRRFETHRRPRRQQSVAGAAWAVSRITGGRPGTSRSHARVQKQPSCHPTHRGDRLHRVAGKLLRGSRMIGRAEKKGATSPRPGSLAPQGSGLPAAVEPSCRSRARSCPGLGRKFLIRRNSPERRRATSGRSRSVRRDPRGEERSSAPRSRGGELPSIATMLARHRLRPRARRP